MKGKGRKIGKIRKEVSLKVTNKRSRLLICQKINLNLISFSSIIVTPVRNLANLLKFIGLYSLNQNSEWILINLIIKNSKE
jgi:hypothetical protein